METANIAHQDASTYIASQWAPPPSSSTPPMGHETVQSTTPLLLAFVMFTIAYQLWRGQPGTGCAISRKIMIAYTLAMGFFEVARGLFDAEPIVVPVLSITHTIWEWAIVGYMFFDSRASTSSSSWILSRLWIWLLSKAVALVMALPTKHLEVFGAGQDTITGHWTGHILIAVILFRAMCCLRAWGMEALIYQEVMLPFTGGNRCSTYKNCRLSHYPRRNWFSRLI